MNRRKSHGLPTEADRHPADLKCVPQALWPRVVRHCNFSESRVRAGTSASRVSAIVCRDLFGRLEWSRRRPVDDEWELVAGEMSARGQVGYVASAEVVWCRYPEA